ncbi:hypothetical protein [Paenibacillus sp.]|uniref:lipopolysaccharide biosynthesis protein n=1 Tax=Paenibacillus sp. TaxID=58172 RepID=UPI002D6629BF|nr:hypothetical protein [Paenibacillus sp.]HZG84984.1 hypothetical protein [Paenibacillus sp.]
MRAKKALYCTITSFAFQFLAIIVGFIQPRILIEVYGSSTNGLVMAIAQFIRYFSVLELGLAGAVIYKLYKPLEVEDNNDINKILSSTKHYYWRIGIVYSTLVIGFSSIYPFIINAEEIPKITVFLLVLIVGCSGSIEFFLLSKYRVLLVADQRSYVINLVSILVLIINSIIIIGMALLDFNIALVQSTALSTYFIRFAIIYFYIKRKYPNVNYNFKGHYISFDNRNDVLIMQVAGLLIWNSPFFIISILIGVTEVSIYAIYNLVFSGLDGVLSSLNNGLQAGFGRLLATQKRNIFIKAYKEYELISFTISSWMFSCSAILILPFINVYTKGITDANYINPILAFLFVITYFVGKGLTMPYMTIVNSAGLFKEVSKPLLITSITSILLSILFAMLYRIEGILVITFFTVTIVLVIFIKVATTKVTEIAIRATIFNILKTLSISIIGIVTFDYICPLDISNYKDWVITAIIATFWIGFVLIVGNLLLNRTAFLEVLKRVKAVMKK